MRKPETKQIVRTIYKSGIISGSIMIANDGAQHLQYGKTSTPFGKLLKNFASSAIGYAIGKKAADITWDAIELAIEKYNEEA